MGGKGVLLCSMAGIGLLLWSALTPQNVSHADATIVARRIRSADVDATQTEQPIHSPELSIRVNHPTELGQPRSGSLPNPSASEPRPLTSPESSQARMTPVPEKLWFQDSHHVAALDFLDRLGKYSFEPAGEPFFAGENEQGFQQFQYTGLANETVMQWYWSDGFLAVEQIEQADGSRIVRRFHDHSDRLQEVTYENQDHFRSATYDESSSPESLTAGEDGRRTYFEYDRHGRIVRSGGAI